MASLQGSKTEYHHYIPQFILRNFAHKYSPTHDVSVTSSRRRKKNKKTKLYPGDLVLHSIDLSHEAPQISETPVKRTFGMMDMYRDVSNAADHNFLEKEIGKLESRVSQILADIRKALESGKSGFSMPRHERDILRKFLFIMKFRGPRFHRRFHGDESGNYTDDDADRLKKYMQEKRIQKAADVWFRSIKTILELKMDLEGKWMKRLVSAIYPDDAMWFIAHTEWYFLAFCTPDNPNDEFILTENCYNVHEGPNSTVLNPETGEHEVTAWTSYHEFSPITPKLMLVLRSALLPNPEEDLNENIKKCRNAMLEASSSFHGNPTAAVATSFLQDLPIKKPRNSYSQVSTGGIQLLPGEDGSRRSYHRFTFPFFKLNTDQVGRLNCVLLENAHLTSLIAFNSRSSLKRSLEYYLQLPNDRGFKLVLPHEKDARLTYLKKLEFVAKSLGSTLNLVYKEAAAVVESENEKRKLLDQLQKEMLKHLPEQPSEFMQLYNKLGGSRDTIFKDMDQAGKMRFLRIKVDVCTKRFPEATREKVREHLRDLFCQLPSRRLWIYLKSLRAMSLGTPETLDERLASDMEGPEDVIVKVSHIVRPECLGRLLHFTVMQDIQHRKTPGLGPSTDFTLDAAGARLLQRITQLTFASVGSICDCGIKCIQEAATNVAAMIRYTKAYEGKANPVWTVDENIEVLTRTFVRGDMQSLLSNSLSEDAVEELSDVFFDILYPAYSKRPIC